MPSFGAIMFGSVRLSAYSMLKGGSGLGEGGYKCQLSTIYQISVTFKAICHLSVKLLLIINLAS